MSVGLFQHDLTCLQNLCQSQYAHEVNLWCHVITSEFDGWAIGAYITSKAHEKDWSNTGTLPSLGDSYKVNIYGGGLFDPTLTEPTKHDAANKLDFTYRFYAIGFHHENMGDTFAAVSYLGYYNPCQGVCSNSYV